MYSLSCSPIFSAYSESEQDISPKIKTPSYQSAFLAQLMTVDVQGLAKNPLDASLHYDQRQFAANANAIFLDQVV